MCILVEGDLVGDIQVDHIDIVFATLVDGVGVTRHLSLDERLLEHFLPHLLILFAELQEFDATDGLNKNIDIGKVLLMETIILINLEASMLLYEDLEDFFYPSI